MLIITVNAASERREPRSILSLYRQLIELRRKLPALVVGDYRSWKFSNEAHVQSGALTAGFASAAIEMIYDLNNGYNLVGHQLVLVSKKQSVDDATQAIRDLSRSIQRTFDELNGPTGDASGSSQTKLDRFLETWRVVADRLGDELDGSDGASLVSKSRRLIDDTGQLIQSSVKRLDKVHYELRDVLDEPLRSEAFYGGRRTSCSTLRI